MIKPPGDPEFTRAGAVHATMSYAASPFQFRQDILRMPQFRIALMMSVLLHALMLWQLPARLRDPAQETVPPPITVQLLPPPGPPAAVLLTPPAAVIPPAPTAPQPPQPRAQPAPPTPVEPAPVAPAPPVSDAIPLPTPPLAAKPVPAPPEGDLAAYIEARRRAAAPAPTQPAEDENARASRLAAANLRLQQPAVGYDPSKSGGIFQVTRVGYDYAEFTFFGWHREVRRDIAQQYEVRKGNNATIQLAVVRKMIEIIREYEQEDFTWNSHRLGRSLKLSARQRDTATLEEFLQREFFDRPSRR